MGDIVYVRYDFPYCAEIGDGHYGVVMSEIQGSSYLVIPLSSEPYKNLKSLVKIYRVSKFSY